MSVGVGDEVNDEEVEDEGDSVLGTSGIAMGAGLAVAGSESSGKSS